MCEKRIGGAYSNNLFFCSVRPSPERVSVPAEDPLLVLVLSAQTTCPVLIPTRPGTVSFPRINKVKIQNSKIFITFNK